MQRGMFGSIQQYETPTNVSVFEKKIDTLSTDFKKETESIAAKCAGLEAKWNELVEGRVKILSQALQTYLRDKYEANCKSIHDVAIPSEADNSLEDLSCDLFSMLESNQHADITIKCGDKVYRAHKCLLCARSPVFQAMFSCQMRENVDNTVVIDDLKPVTVHNLLQFMYSGRIKDMDSQLAYDLISAAEKYQIESLKSTCIKFLKSRISVETAAETLVCGDMYDAGLKAFALDYMCKEIKALQSAESWKRLQASNPALALEVYSLTLSELLK